MATLAMTIDNFEETILGNDIVLIDFWADWCGPCKTFGPVFEKVSENHPDIVFAKVDTEAEQEIAGQFGIRSIPTLAIFREKILLFNQSGALPETTLEEVVARVKDLDMDEVRTAIAEEKAKAEAAGAPSNDA